MFKRVVGVFAITLAPQASANYPVVALDSAAASISLIGNRAIVMRIMTGRGARNFRPLNDSRRPCVPNRGDSTISELDPMTLTKVKEITGLPPGRDDME